LAHSYCQGKGIELGAAAHNPFNLPESINVSPYSDDASDPEYEDYVTYKKHQIENCGRYAEIDLAGEASRLPVPAGSQAYVVSSHVVEHMPDLIGAFLEWNRVLREGGVVFMIFPKRDAAGLDAVRGLTPLEHFVEDFVFQRTPETHPFDGIEPRRRGHYHVFDLKSMLDLIDWCNCRLGLNWEILEVEQTDTKVGNGHTIVARYLGALQDQEVRRRVAREELSSMTDASSPLARGRNDDEQASSPEAELRSIKSTLSWAVLQEWWRFGLWIMPPGTHRRRVYGKLTSRLSRFLRERQEP
jgi:SAM-dependent methyltransferase